MSKIKFEQEGIVFDIQRFSVHDGPGIRTIVFLKGCPLSCRWCSNPESQQLKPLLMFEPKRCVQCHKCIAVCPVQALSFTNPYFVDRNKCISCGACAEACLPDALVMKGETMTVWQVMQELQKDATTYRRSGGGITLSGGEPLLQSDFARELLKACHNQGWNTAMETTGFASKEVIQDVMPHVDFAMADLKAIDPQVHKDWTGVDNRQILENLLRISQLAGKTVVRVPVIPGINDDDFAMQGVAEFASLMGIDTIHLLPYHSYGENKYGLLGRSYPMGNTPSPAPELVESLKQVIEAHHFKCVIGG